MQQDSQSSTANGIELLRPLDGKEGRVWLARETALRREVVLKFQSGATDAAHAALLREADILARCDHPSIVPFYRAIPAEPPFGAFYAMKALPTSLRDRLASGRPLNESAIRRLGREIAEALACLHGLSTPVAHRNVRAESVLFDKGGHAVLTGFGSARSLGEVGADAAADDVMALGRLLEETLRACRGHIGLRWKDLLRRMLSDDPSVRPTASEVAMALSGRPAGRKRFWALAAAGAAAIAAAAVALFATPDDEAVVDETISPAVTSATSLRPRFPAFSPEAMGRIPWYCYLNEFALSYPGMAEYKSRVYAFEARNPGWTSTNANVFAGAQRIIRLPGGVQIEMAAIPYGYYRRGFFLASNSVDRAECLITPETVLISRRFWMARTELTRAQYAAVMRHAPAVSSHSARRLLPWEGRRGRPLEIEGGDMPVGEDLDLADILRFIDALNELCGLEGERRFRLPTEAEWEHACRAFVARPFEGEKDFGDAAWTSANSGGTPHPVAQKAQNPFGLFDMHGNLAEWCADAYGPLGEYVPFDPLVEPSSNSAPRVVRGGSFRDAEAACDSNVRAAARPTDKGQAIRLVALP